MSERVVEQIVGEPSPHIMEEVEAARLIPQERCQHRIVKETVYFLVPHIQEHVVEVMKVIHQERVLERIVPPHIQEHVVEVMKVIHQERVLERIVAPHIQEHVVEVMKVISRSGCWNASWHHTSRSMLLK